MCAGLCVGGDGHRREHSIRFTPDSNRGPEGRQRKTQGSERASEERLVELHWSDEEATTSSGTWESPRWRKAQPGPAAGKPLKCPRTGTKRKKKGLVGLGWSEGAQVPGDELAGREGRVCWKPGSASRGNKESCWRAPGTVSSYFKNIFHRRSLAGGWERGGVGRRELASATEIDVSGATRGVAARPQQHGSLPRLRGPASLLWRSSALLGLLGHQLSAFPHLLLVLPRLPPSPTPAQGPPSHPHPLRRRPLSKQGQLGGWGGTLTPSSRVS